MIQIELAKWVVSALWVMGSGGLSVCKIIGFRSRFLIVSCNQSGWTVAWKGFGVKASCGGVSIMSEFCVGDAYAGDWDPKLLGYGEILRGLCDLWRKLYFLNEVSRAGLYNPGIGEIGVNSELLKNFGSFLSEQYVKLLNKISDMENNLFFIQAP